MAPSAASLDLGAGETHEIAPALALIYYEGAELGRRGDLGERAETVERGVAFGRFEADVDGGLGLVDDRLRRAVWRHHAGPGGEREVREAAFDHRGHVGNLRPALGARHGDRPKL